VSKITFTLNGRQAETEEGKTILEAAQDQGIIIPALCHDPRLKPAAACRLCLVEVEKARGPLPACSTLVAPGMTIKTHTEAIIEGRKIALELLLSEHTGDCLSPCHLACPAGIDIQGQVAYIANGQFREALKLIKESNPLPMVCGRVCPAFCEKKCRRERVDEPVAINLLKRFVADLELEDDSPYLPEIKPASGHRVAIVGGGPAGLTAAHFLALEGHDVSIFDAGDELGGMLRYGIPEYRLPKAVLTKEIAAITRLCRGVHSRVSLGRDFTLRSLKSDGFEAIFLALGARVNQSAPIKGEEVPGVFSGIEFLSLAARLLKMELGRQVAVIGGGNTAIDAARTALRLGAREVTILYRRSRKEMPASPEEIEGAEQEGVKFLFLVSPLEIMSQEGCVKSIKCTRMALGAPDRSGRRRPEPVSGSEFTFDAGAVILATGQAVDTACLDPDSRTSLCKNDRIESNVDTQETALAGIFAGGDCSSGPATVVEAIGAGRRAAISIDQYLRNGKVIPVRKPYNCSKGELSGFDPAEFADIVPVPRSQMPVLEPDKRKNNFMEISLGISAETAQKEAGRCLSCGCQAVFECKLRDLATEYQVDDKKYAGQKQHFPIRKDEHPFILRDRNKCILCSRCVRICSEVEGINALGFVHRGVHTSIEPTLGMPLAETACDSCGLCVSTCPTGATVLKLPLPKPGPFKPLPAAPVCPDCGSSSRRLFHVCGKHLIKAGA
jgi:formate dehydrogenase major subunit